MSATMNLAVALSTPCPPASQAPRPGAGEASDGGFAQCLDQARDSEAPREAEPASDAASETARDAGKPRQTRSGAANEAPRRNAPAQDATKAPAAKASGTADPSEPASGSRRGSQDEGDDSAGVDLAALLPGWVAPAPSTAAATQTADVTQANAAVPGAPRLPVPTDGADTLAAALPAGARSLAAASPTIGANGDALPARPLRVEAPPVDPSQDGVAHASLAHATLEASALVAAAAGVRTQHELQRGERDAASALPPLLSLAGAAGVAHATPATAASAATVSVHVAAAVDSAAFAPSLATQLRWLARDGVQQAELTLNPAEMGPVAVKIALLDAREARIDFSADLAATRSALEASLPVLAAALDDSGLRLTGGGVHDGQARHQPAWSAHAGAASAGVAAPQGDAAAAPLGSARREAPQRGLIDLVA